MKHWLGILLLRMALAIAIVASLLVGLALFQLVHNVAVHFETGWMRGVGYGPFLVEVVAVPLCILWAPFGAMIAARLSRRGSAGNRNYAVIGAAYSVLFLIPWLFLVMRLRGYRVSKPFIWIAYTLVYGGWVLGPIGIGAFAVAATLGITYDVVGARYWAIAAFTALSLAWCISLYLLLDNTLVLGRRKDNGKDGNGVIGGIYLAPFWLFLASVLTFPSLLLFSILSL